MSEKQLWACDRCGSVYYQDEMPMGCNGCGGKHPDAGGGIVHPSQHVTFSEVER